MCDITIQAILVGLKQEGNHSESIYTQGVDIHSSTKQGSGVARYRLWKQLDYPPSRPPSKSNKSKWSGIHFTEITLLWVIIVVSCQGGMSSLWSIVRVVCSQCGLLSGWPVIIMVLCQGGLSSLWSIVRVACHHGGLFSGWPVIMVVCCQGGPSSGWSVVRVAHHHGGLLSGWSVIRSSHISCSMTSHLPIGQYR